MAKECATHDPSFRRDINRMDEVLQQLENPPSWTILGKETAPPSHHKYLKLTPTRRRAPQARRVKPGQHRRALPAALHRRPGRPLQQAPGGRDQTRGRGRPLKRGDRGRVRHGRRLARGGDNRGVLPRVRDHTTTTAGRGGHGGRRHGLDPGLGVFGRWCRGRL